MCFRSWNLIPSEQLRVSAPLMKHLLLTAFLLARGRRQNRSLHRKTRVEAHEAISLEPAAVRDLGTMPPPVEKSVS